MCVCLSAVGSVLRVSEPVCARGCHWVGLLVFLKSDPNMPELPNGEYSQTFHLAHQAWEAPLSPQ